MSKPREISDAFLKHIQKQSEKSVNEFAGACYNAAIADVCALLRSEECEGRIWYNHDYADFIEKHFGGGE